MIELPLCGTMQHDSLACAKVYFGPLGRGLYVELRSRVLTTIFLIK